VDVLRAIFLVNGWGTEPKRFCASLTQKALLSIFFHRHLETASPEPLVNSILQLLSVRAVIDHG